LIAELLSFLTNFQAAIIPFIENYGIWIYILLFLLTALEAGLVLTPFLPGNTLLFVAGALAAGDHLDLSLLLIVFFLAAILSDSSNYWLGRLLGNAIFGSRYLAFLKGKYLDRVQGFYEKYGGRAILVARFFPYVRPLSPFIAGMVMMEYPKFIRYDFPACAIWTAVFVILGYFFGDIPLVQNSINLLAVAFVVVTLITVVFMIIRMLMTMRNPSPPV
jgi:membrane-associated protein